MSRQDDRVPAIRMAITPEPTEEEVAAIAAVVTALVASSGAGEAGREPSPDRWAIAGRQEALRGPLWPAGRPQDLRQ